MLVCVFSKCAEVYALCMMRNISMKCSETIPIRLMNRHGRLVKIECCQMIAFQIIFSTCMVYV